ncbi:MAG: flagellar hook-basal body complex protein FliE [Candidatus Manganitrophaceae bacterium]|nr:MAG: flagellar hook-basal body complex protein FliE [Candidatus Manganitrophaceae bacterium]
MAIQPIGPNQINPAQAAGGIEKSEASFAETLKESIRQVNDAQLQADQAITDLTAGKQQDLHQTMIAIEKANLSFELMMQVRNKILSAYEEISRMQI